MIHLWQRVFGDGAESDSSSSDPVSTRQDPGWRPDNKTDEDQIQPAHLSVSLLSRVKNQHAAANVQSSGVTFTVPPRRKRTLQLDPIQQSLGGDMKRTLYTFTEPLISKRKVVHDLPNQPMKKKKKKSEIDTNQPQSSHDRPANLRGTWDLPENSEFTRFATQHRRKEGVILRMNRMENGFVKRSNGVDTSIPGLLNHCKRVFWPAWTFQESENKDDHVAVTVVTSHRVPDKKLQGRALGLHVDHEIAYLVCLLQIVNISLSDFLNGRYGSQPLTRTQLQAQTQLQGAKYWMHPYTTAALRSLHTNQLEPLACQVVVADREMKIATAVDIVCRDQSKKQVRKRPTLVVVELKCGFDNYNEASCGMMSPPFSHLEDSPHRQHQLQLAFTQLFFRHTFKNVNVFARLMRVHTTGVTMTALPASVTDYMDRALLAILAPPRRLDFYRPSALQLPVVSYDPSRLYSTEWLRDYMSGQVKKLAAPYRTFGVALIGNEWARVVHIDATNASIERGPRGEAVFRGVIWCRTSDPNRAVFDVKRALTLRDLTQTTIPASVITSMRRLWPDITRDTTSELLQYRLKQCLIKARVAAGNARNPRVQE